MDIKEKKEEMENTIEQTEEEKLTLDEVIEKERNEKEKIENNKEINPKKTNHILKIIIIVIAIALFIAIFSTIFSILNINNTKIISGISIKGIDVSNLSKEEAIKKIEEKTNDELSKDIIMTYKEFTTTINPTQIEFKYDIKNAVDEAYATGRSGNIIENNYEILKTMIIKKDTLLKYENNEESLKTIIDDTETKLPGAIKQSSYYIEDDNLIITSGEKGETIQKDRLKALILEKIQLSSEKEKQLTIPTQISEPEPINIEKIYNEIYTEPKDAYYTKDPFVIYPEVIGVDFAITMDEAKQILQEKKETYTIKLKYTTPEYTKESIGSEAFPDLLSTFNTKYDVTNRNRSTNLRLASDKINGTVVMPGEKFSYNKVVGERTIAAGYKDAKIYSNGEVIDGLGGGICQISSTLYNSVVRANLEIITRRNHQFVTSYLPAGLDATVVYGSQDFVFQNSRKYPIKIVSEVKNGVAKIDIYGIKEDIEYNVELEPVVINYIPFTTKYIEDSSLPSGKEVVDQKGANGVKTVTYKYLKLNGNIISKTTFTTDTYNPMQKIVRVGVGAEEKSEQSPETEIQTSEPIQEEILEETIEQPEEAEESTEV